MSQNQKSYRFFKAIRGSGRRGAILPLFAILLLVFMGFMGVAIYTGVTAYVQDQLHAAALNAALAGSSSCNDDITTDTTPQQAVGINNVIPVAQTGWSKQYAASGLLQGINASASVSYSLGGNIAPGSQTCSVTVVARGSMPAPFLDVIGGGDIAFNAVAVAAHDYQIFNGGGMQRAVRNAPSQNCEHSDSAFFFPTGPKLFMPITDRPGPDFYIIEEHITEFFPGYIIEGCAGGVCYDLGDAANTADYGAEDAHSITSGAGEHFSRWQTYPDGVERKVVFGPAVVDLGGKGERYDHNISKITSIRLVDDGLPDLVIAGGGQTRALQLSCPGNMEMRTMRSWAHSQACVSQGPPAGVDPSEHQFYTADCAIPPTPMSLW